MFNKYVFVYYHLSKFYKASNDGNLFTLPPSDTNVGVPFKRFQTAPDT